MTRTQVLLIGLDSAGALGDDAVWASFATAVAPGRHGRFFWHPVDRGSYDSIMSRDRPPPIPQFWVALSDRGRQVVDWLVHGRDYTATQSDPPEWAETVLSRFGGDATDIPTADFLCAGDPLPPEKIAGFRQHLLYGIERKSRLATELLDEGGWDLFLVVFKESHCVGHQCPNGTEAGGDAVKAVYRALDNAVGQLAERAGDDCQIIVFSDSADRAPSDYLAAAAAKVSSPGCAEERACGPFGLPVGA